MGGKDGDESAWRRWVSTFLTGIVLLKFSKSEFVAFAVGPEGG